MSKKLYDLTVATGKYTDNTGQEKTQWKNIGSIWENERDGKINRFMMLDATFNPAAIERKQGSNSIVVNLFAPKDKQKQSQSTNTQSRTYGDDAPNNIEMSPIDFNNNGFFDGNQSNIPF